MGHPHQPPRAPTTDFRQRADERVDLVVSHGLLLADKRKAHRQAPQIPGEWAHIRLVKIDHVEEQSARRVEVVTEVVNMQIAMDPDPARALIEKGILVGG